MVRSLSGVAYVPAVFVVMNLSASRSHSVSPALAFSHSLALSRRRCKHLARRCRHRFRKFSHWSGGAKSSRVSGVGFRVWLSSRKGNFEKSRSGIRNWMQVQIFKTFKLHSTQGPSNLDQSQFEIFSQLVAINAHHMAPRMVTAPRTPSPRDNPRKAFCGFPLDSGWRGERFINLQTRPLHANEGDRTTRRALARNHPKGWNSQ